MSRVVEAALLLGVVIATTAIGWALRSTVGWLPATLLAAVIGGIIGYEVGAWVRR